MDMTVLWGGAGNFAAITGSFDAVEGVDNEDDFVNAVNRFAERFGYVRELQVSVTILAELLYRIEC
jgi:hypothetical protein